MKLISVFIIIRIKSLQIGIALLCMQCSVLSANIVRADDIAATKTSTASTQYEGLICGYDLYNVSKNIEYNDLDSNTNNKLLDCIYETLSDKYFNSKLEKMRLSPIKSMNDDSASSFKQINTFKSYAQMNSISESEIRPRIISALKGDVSVIHSIIQYYASTREERLAALWREFAALQGDVYHIADIRSANSYDPRAWDILADTFTHKYGARSVRLHGEHLYHRINFIFKLLDEKKTNKYYLDIAQRLEKSFYNKTKYNDRCLTSEELTLLFNITLDRGILFELNEQNSIRTLWVNIFKACGEDVVKLLLSKKEKEYSYFLFSYIGNKLQAGDYVRIVKATLDICTTEMSRVCDAILSEINRQILMSSN